MANWTVVGVLGAGKTLLSLCRVRDWLLQNRKLASNVDIFLEWLMPPMSKVTYTRLTDFPDLDELLALGKGGDSPKEKSFGILWLDELAMFLNSRSWQKDGRDDLIIYQRHIRKKRWHTLFNVQDVDSIDKQARNALVENVVVAGRTDRLRIPVIGGFLQFFGFSGMRQQKHLGYVYYGKTIKIGQKHNDVWEYKGTDYHAAYDTEQEFEPNRLVEVDINGQKRQVTEGRWREWRIYGKRSKNENLPTYYDVEILAPYTVLSAWHLYGRYLTTYQLYEKPIRIFFIMLMIIFAGFLFIGTSDKSPDDLPTGCLNPDSYLQNGYQVSILYNRAVLPGVIKNGKAYTKHQCFNLN